MLLETVKLWSKATRSETILISIAPVILGTFLAATSHTINYFIYSTKPRIFVKQKRQ